MLNLTGALTKDIREIEKMYRLAVFNVLAHNRDDHSKNFSFLMNELGEWKFSPAYDITFSSGPGGEQSTMVMGEGKNPTTKHLAKLGVDAKLPKGLVENIIGQTQYALSKFVSLAKAFGIDKEHLHLINQTMQ